MTALTPTFDWPYPQRTDPADMSYGLKSLAEAVEATLQGIENEITAQQTRYNNRKIFFGRRVAAQSIGNAAWVVVPLDTVEVNQVGSSVVSGPVVAIAGTYLIAGGASWATVGGEPGERITGLIVNSTVVSQSGSPPPLASQVHPVVHNTMARAINLNAGDEVKLAVWQSSGAPLALNVAAGYQPHLTVLHLWGPWS